jgi:nucleotide-binding universal stress UspA family protein
VRHGGVVEEILAESEEVDYDLVVIGAHREAGWQRVLLADIARELIKRLERPVLVVR